MKSERRLRIHSGAVLLMLLCTLLFTGCGVSRPNADNETGMQCTVSINCVNALDYSDRMPDGLVELLSADGVVLDEVTVSINEGDSVFTVLQRTAKEYSIPMEYVDTPLYDSAYIEGIANLYEFDCGEQSGWMYSVNGQFPPVGCSSFKVEDGDSICWVYTCDLGQDVGNEYGTVQR